MKTLALIGECMIELNGEPFGEMRQSYGGDSLNTATYLARISKKERLDVRYVSVMGQDKLSQGMIERWQTDGINTDWVLRDPLRQAGLYLIQLDRQGERTFLYWRDQSAARYLLQHIDYPKVLCELKKVDMIYLSGISLAILPENDRSLLIAQLADLKKAGVKIAFDSNYRPALWQSPEKTREIYTALLPLLDVALLTFDDEQALWGDQTVSESLQRLAKIGVPNIVIKQGKAGATLVENGQVQIIPTEPISSVVDTTSAGDAFNAGFLQGYLQGKALKVCCEQGNRLAGIVIQHKGAIIASSATAHLRQEFN